jgi:acyl-coenzyme A synthetase/AMP-(fatty) acid ligase
VFAHEECLERVVPAAVACHIPTSRIVVISSTEESVLPETSQGVGYLTMAELTRLGKRESSSTPQVALESHNSPIAFLCFSSGTTGLPKVRVYRQKVFSG